MKDKASSDGAPPLIADTKAKKKRQRKFIHRLPVFFVEHRASGWWIKLPPEQAGGHDNTWLGPFVYLEPACLAIARRYACETAEKYTIWAGQNGIDPEGLKPTTRLEPPSEQPAEPPDPGVF